MTVAVEASLFQTGRPVSLFLGEALNPSCRAAASTDGRYVIRAELLECGSKLSASKDFVIYSNKLVFSPAYGSSGLGRSPPAVVPVSCRYKRRNVVSSNPQQSLVLSSPAQERTLTLQLMSDDWLHERASKVFTLGDILHLQALYMGPDPGQRRVFIDNCVATLSPDPRSVPRYYFITNHGCLVDTKQGGLASRFQPRQKDHSLQLELDVFLFDGHSRNLIFITCQLKVTSKKSESSFVNKACSYEKSRWKNVDGNDDVCQCCDGTCSRNTRADQRHLSEILTCASASVGPLTVYPRK
ncbi:unnamed protein product [Tetraodon nigroviridis]|uniref:Zona pellucida sperm-binding protein 3 n=1 Tax=Tetraodon nigroviridis TaxID=99883 RepID=Q4T0A5_TETNG|nr:unnamed protein product [Tetraodon nigroviridis]